MQGILNSCWRLLALLASSPFQIKDCYRCTQMASKKITANYALPQPTPHPANYPDNRHLRIVNFTASTIANKRQSDGDS